MEEGLILVWLLCIYVSLFVIEIRLVDCGLIFIISLQEFNMGYFFLFNWCGFWQQCVLILVLVFSMLVFLLDDEGIMLDIDFVIFEIQGIIDLFEQGQFFINELCIFVDVFDCIK